MIVSYYKKTYTNELYYYWTYELRDFLDFSIKSLHGNLSYMKKLFFVDNKKDFRRKTWKKYRWGFDLKIAEMRYRQFLNTFVEVLLEETIVKGNMWKMETRDKKFFALFGCYYKRKLRFQVKPHRLTKKYRDSPLKLYRFKRLALLMPPRVRREVGVDYGVGVFSKYIHLQNKMNQKQLETYD